MPRSGFRSVRGWRQSENVSPGSPLTGACFGPSHHCWQDVFACALALRARLDIALRMSVRPLYWALYFQFKKPQTYGSARKIEPQVVSCVALIAYLPLVDPLIPLALVPPS